MIETFKEAKLLPHEVAHVLGISRVTVSMWYNGHTKPHRLHEDKVQKLVDDVKQAMESAALPVPSGVARRDRLDYIGSTLKQD
jgi:predicted transcriptional regulator